MKFFLRDAENIRQADAVILVGSRSSVMSLNCRYCGYPTCVAKNEHPDVPCAINMTDLGIAIGSMTAKAADLRVDSRVMFSVGFAARRIGLLTDCPRSLRHSAQRIFQKSVFRQTIDTLIIALYV